MLDQGAAGIEDGGSFATTIRPWLGDQIAFGLYEYDENTMSNDQPIVVVVSINDQAAAEDFLTLTSTTDDYTASEEDGYTLYAPDSGNTRNEPYFIFRDGVMIITSTQDVVDAGGVFADGLSSSDAFTTAATMLPENEYGLFGYIDTPVIFTSSMMDQLGSMNSEEMAMVTPFLDILQPQAFGLTKLGDNGLVIDFASPLNADADVGFSMTATAPIDPAFAAHIPATSALVVHGTNLYQSYQGGLESLNAMSEMMADNPDFDAQDMQTVLWGLRFAVRGLTGMEPEDALGWMTGDYAFAVGLSPAFADASNVMGALDALPVDFGLVIDATDTDGAQALYDGLSRSLSGLPAEEVTVSEETLSGDVNALVFTIDARQMDYPIELVVATGNGVFAVGTRRMVEAAVNPANGLDSDADFAAASATLLEGASSVLYVSSSGLQPLARVLSASSNPENIQDGGKQLKAVLGLFDSLSISTTVEADGSGTVARFVWTLPE